MSKRRYINNPRTFFNLVMTKRINYNETVAVNLPVSAVFFPVIKRRLQGKSKKEKRALQRADWIQSAFGRIRTFGGKVVCGRGKKPKI